MIYKQGERVGEVTYAVYRTCSLRQNVGGPIRSISESDVKIISKLLCTVGAVLVRTIQK